jgi:hypothetical protein
VAGGTHRNLPAQIGWPGSIRGSAFRPLSFRVRVEPARLNFVMAWLFMVGASCFALGAISAYVHAVGASADAITFFVGSIFFTSASYLQLVQVQSPGMTEVDEQHQHTHVRALLWAWRPGDKNWLAAATQFPGTLFFNISTFAETAHNLTAAQADRQVWRPDIFGSILFVVASAYAISALGVGFGRLRSLPWSIAWINMVGSVAFMASALASFVLPRTDAMIDIPLANAATFLGAVCFLVAAALLLPAWRTSVRSKSRCGHPAG